MAHVRASMVVRRQRVTFLVIQPVAVSRYAGHEDITREPVSAQGSHGGFYLGGGGAALPVVDVIVYGVEAAAGQGLADRFGVIPVSRQVVHAPAEVVLRLTMQDRHIVAGLYQFFHQGPPDEQGSPNDQHSHTTPRVLDAPAKRKASLRPLGIFQKVPRL